jgi:hypothetical protein
MQSFFFSKWIVLASQVHFGSEEIDEDREREAQGA